MEADTPEYWQMRIERWKSIKDDIVESLGEKYYLDHLKKFEKNQKDADKENKA